jgi:hypothetical protein
MTPLDSNFGVCIQTLSEPEYASSYGLIDAPAKPLCFTTNGVANENINQLIPDDFLNYTSNGLLRCVGYKNSWYLKYPIQLYVNHGGYLFCILEKEWEQDEDRKWVNKCSMIGRQNKIGKGAYAVVQTSRDINSFNSFNDGTSLLGSISDWILNTLKLDTEDKQRSKFPKLVFNEPIFYIPPQESPLTLKDTTITTSRSQNSVVKILEFIYNLIDGNSIGGIPLSEFTFYFSSSKPDVAAVTTIWEPTNITFKQTGTFILNGTQQFYQNRDRNVAFKKKDFAITVNLTIS